MKYFLCDANRDVGGDLADARVAPDQLESLHDFLLGVRRVPLWYQLGTYCCTRQSSTSQVPNWYYTGHMEDERRESIGATIRTLREARGKSRQDLADAAEISLQMLAKIEQGSKAPSAATLSRLAHGLGIDTPDLAQRANAWQAFAAAGASRAALRAGTITGTLGAGIGAAVGAVLMPGVSGVATVGALAVHRELRNRRVIEALLRSNLDLSADDLQDVANQLGVDFPEGTTK